MLQSITNYKWPLVATVGGIRLVEWIQNGQETQQHLRILLFRASKMYSYCITYEFTCKIQGSIKYECLVSVRVYALNLVTEMDGEQHS